VDPRRELAARVAARYGALPGVRAVALAGSEGSGVADARSDLDLYVYADPIPSLAERAAAAAGAAGRREVGNAFFEPGDEWVDGASGDRLDVMFRSPGWIEEELDRVLVRHQARVGYSTCFWHNLLASAPLHDPQGWYAALRERARVPYPPELRRAVIRKNHPLLRDNLSSFAVQLEWAAEREDRVSLVHRTAALLASFFDVLFALNELAHPGEKRLLSFAEARCPRRPPGLRARVEALAQAAGAGLPVQAAVDALLDPLDALLRAEGLLEQLPRAPGPG
jgi:hypothetical protein